jgi:hypothetical protein
MPVPSYIVDPHNGLAARVTEFGQLVTSPIAYSTPVAQILTVVDTAYNFIEPEANHQIVITDIILTADKNVGASGASVQIYCADSIDSTTVLTDGGVLDIEMLKNTSRDLIGLNFLVTEGFWINAKTDDNNVQLTIGYYRVPID